MTDAGTSRFSVRGAPRWLVAVLVASLAINLVVAGLIGAAMWRFRGPHHVASPVIPNLLGYASTLPTERRKVLWDAIAEERNHIRPFRREVRAAREEAIKALIAEPFDREQFRTAQGRQAETENRAREAVQNLYVKLATTLTPEERQAFPRWREQRRPGVRNLLDEPDHQAGEPAQSR